MNRLEYLMYLNKITKSIVNTKLDKDEYTPEFGGLIDDVWLKLNETSEELIRPEDWGNGKLREDLK